MIIRGGPLNVPTGRMFWLLALLLAPPTAMAATGQCVQAAIEPLAKKLAADFAAKHLAGLDKERPYLKPIQFIVEHSITDDYEVEEMSNFSAIEQWLTGQEPEGMPVREARPLRWCKKGLCVFDLSAGIAHNHRYVQKLTYGYESGCPYLKSIFLLDGD